MQKMPQVGDRYTELFQSDLDERELTEAEVLTIAEVEYQCDDGETWTITADDGTGYDCVWSDRHQIWCYNLG